MKRIIVIIIVGKLRKKSKWLPVNEPGNWLISFSPDGSVVSINGIMLSACYEIKDMFSKHLNQTSFSWWVHLYYEIKDMFSKHLNQTSFSWWVHLYYFITWWLVHIDQLSPAVTNSSYC